MLKTTTVRGVMVRVASHVSGRRSLHVTVMSAQPSPAQPSQPAVCTWHLAARGRMLCSTGRHSIHRTLCAVQA